MTSELTREALVERQLLDAARVVGELMDGRRFTMTIPAREDNDDIVLMKAIQDALALLRERAAPSGRNREWEAGCDTAARFVADLAGRRAGDADGVASMLYDIAGDLRRLMSQRAAPSGPHCADCGLPHASDAWCDAVVPDAIWRKIGPTGDEGGLLCFNCMSARAVRAGYGPDRRVFLKITSGPWTTGPERAAPSEAETLERAAEIMERRHTCGEAVTALRYVAGLLRAAPAAAGTEERDAAIAIVRDMRAGYPPETEQEQMAAMDAPAQAQYPADAGEASPGDDPYKKAAREIDAYYPEDPDEDVAALLRRHFGGWREALEFYAADLVYGDVARAALSRPAAQSAGEEEKRG